ncbi:MAG: hypothetical protein ACE5H9_17090 [Anaerolineae bacterium]
MTNDVIRLNAIVNDINKCLSDLAELGRGGFQAPLVITPDELAEMMGQPVGQWRVQSNDLLWFYGLKIVAYTRLMLEQSARIFRQVDDREFARRAAQIIDSVDAQFHPCETALKVYGKLSQTIVTGGANES